MERSAHPFSSNPGPSFCKHRQFPPTGWAGRGEGVFRRITHRRWAYLNDLGQRSPLPTFPFLNQVQVSAQGDASFSLPVPAGTSSKFVWFQALVLPSVNFTNAFGQRIE